MRAGRVVGGYDGEASQYTFQNLIQSFSHKHLHHVRVMEPAPPFPVGRECIVCQCDLVTLTFCD